MPNHQQRRSHASHRDSLVAARQGPATRAGNHRDGVARFTQRHRRCTGVLAWHWRDHSRVSGAGPARSGQRRSLSARWRALTCRSRPRPRALTRGSPPGGAQHRYRRDLAHCGWRAHCGRRRPGPCAALRHSHRHDPTHHGRYQPSVGRPTCGPRRAHRAGCCLSGVEQARTVHSSRPPRGRDHPGRSCRACARTRCVGNLCSRAHLSRCSPAAHLGAGRRAARATGRVRCQPTHHRSGPRNAQGAGAPSPRSNGCRLRWRRRPIVGLCHRRVARRPRHSAWARRRTAQRYVVAHTRGDGTRAPRASRPRRRRSLDPSGTRHRATCRHQLRPRCNQPRSRRSSVGAGLSRPACCAPHPTRSVSATHGCGCLGCQRRSVGQRSVRRGGRCRWRSQEHPLAPSGRHRRRRSSRNTGRSSRDPTHSRVGSRSRRHRRASRTPTRQHETRRTRTASRGLGRDHGCAHRPRSDHPTWSPFMERHRDATSSTCRVRSPRQAHRR